MNCLIEQFLFDYQQKLDLIAVSMMDTFYSAHLTHWKNFQKQNIFKALNDLFNDCFYG